MKIAVIHQSADGQPLIAAQIHYQIGKGERVINVVWVDFASWNQLCAGETSCSFPARPEARNLLGSISASVAAQRVSSGNKRKISSKAETRGSAKGDCKSDCKRELGCFNRRT